MEDHIHIITLFGLFEIFNKYQGSRNRIYNFLLSILYPM